LRTLVGSLRLYPQVPKAAAILQLVRRTDVKETGVSIVADLGQLDPVFDRDDATLAAHRSATSGSGS
jgi:hypothetical protein